MKEWTDVNYYVYWFLNPGKRPGNFHDLWDDLLQEYNDDFSEIICTIEAVYKDMFSVTWLKEEKGIGASEIENYLSDHSRREELEEVTQDHWEASLEKWKEIFRDTDAEVPDWVHEL